MNGKDQELFLCKARPDGLRNPSLEREIDSLQRILQATSSPMSLADNNSTSSTCRVPMLKGYVTHPTSGVILGLLRAWVPSELSLRDLQDASEIEHNFKGEPRELRRKWAGQIKRTIQFLHSIGVIWGDAKPSNIIIDSLGDAHLIDFGGGWTEGWVDEKLQETTDGDEQGVARILKFLDAQG